MVDVERRPQMTIPRSIDEVSRCPSCALRRVADVQWDKGYKTASTALHARAARTPHALNCEKGKLVATARDALEVTRGKR